MFSLRTSQCSQYSILHEDSCSSLLFWKFTSILTLIQNLFCTDHSMKIPNLINISSMLLIRSIFCITEKNQAFFFHIKFSNNSIRLKCDDRKAYETNWSFTERKNWIHNQLRTLNFIFHIINRIYIQNRLINVWSDLMSSNFWLILDESVNFQYLISGSDQFLNHSFITSPN